MTRSHFLLPLQVFVSLQNITMIFSGQNKGPMKYLALVFIVFGNSFADSPGDINQSKKYVYFDLPIIGNSFAFIYPSRIFSFSIDASKYSGFSIGPLLGYNKIKGTGLNFGIYSKKNDKHIGVKFALYGADDVGIKEIYLDFQYYSRFTRVFSLRYGFSVGYGANKVQHENYNGTSSTHVEEGATMRLSFDLSWRKVIKDKNFISQSKSPLQNNGFNKGVKINVANSSWVDSTTVKKIITEEPQINPEMPKTLESIKEELEEND
jgi:hypothetical protein